MPRLSLTRRKLSRLLLIAAGSLLVLAIVSGAHTWLANRHANAVARHDVALANAGKPSPAPATIMPTPQAVSSYTVPANNPRYLKIPSLGVNARVYAVGVTKSNAIGTPNNVSDTAWFNQSSRPGQPGVMLIDGHVSSWTTHGVFYNLKILKPGDSIQVQRGDDMLYTYTVVKTRTYDVDQLTAQTLLTPINSAKPGLNLVTCGGGVITGTNEFDKRVVVFASLQS